MVLKALVAALLVGVALAGCSTSVNYVGSASKGLFFKVPKDWEVFSNATLKRVGMAVDPAANSQAAASGSTYTQYVALAGASGHFLAASGPDFFGPYPWALANVVSLGSSDQASLSLQGLNDLLFPVDTWQQDGISVQQLGTTTLLVRGALRGSQVAFEAQTPSGPIAFEQVALIDSPTNQAWDLAVGCSVTCFKAHQAVLAGIVHSFTVTAKGT